MIDQSNQEQRTAARRLADSAPELAAALLRVLAYAEDCAADNDERPGCLDLARAVLRSAGALPAPGCDLFTQEPTE